MSGTCKNLDISVYANTAFSVGQMRTIRIGMEEGLDVSKYASIKFSEYQMIQIHEGLRLGIDLSPYIAGGFDSNRIASILHSMEKGLRFADSNFTCEQMHQICLGVEFNKKESERQIDVTLYAKPEYSDRQMRELRCGMEHGITVSEYANPDIPYLIMRETRHKLEAAGLKDKEDNAHERCVGKTAHKVK